jgi:hypothetical protein
MLLLLLLFLLLLLARGCGVTLVNDNRLDFVCGRLLVVLLLNHFLLAHLG